MTTVQTDPTETDPGRTAGRSRIRHWVLVAAATAAVIAAALAAAPAGGVARPSGPTVGQAGHSDPNGPSGKPGNAPAAALPRESAPDPAKAVLPLDCGPAPVKVSLSFGALLGGRPSTVLAAHCDGGNGTPPDGVFLLTNGQDGRPRVAATLLEESAGRTVTELRLRSDGTLTARAKGYSSDEVPRFAPDLLVSLEWREQADGGWLRSERSEPAATA
ncbi:hypothetical protein ACIRBX_16865 [Kitasatospora sp. NPDC096147]|uniref:hypothetical protein n=1 Tax=Kitasatospora sp. NPDC096147 TaxID=3364093 RepID=UPI00381B073D